MERLQNLSAILTPISAKNPDDVVICAAVRTPLCKAKRGSLKDTTPDHMLTAALKGIL